MPDVSNLVIALAIAAGIFVVCLALAIGIILLASKHPALFANAAPHLLERITRRG